MYRGRLVGIERTEAISDRPGHPHTKALLSAALILRPDRGREAAIRLAGEAPSPIGPRDGCTFHPRRHRRIGVICDRSPPLSQDRGTGKIACHLHDREGAGASRADQVPDA